MIQIDKKSKIWLSTPHMSGYEKAFVDLAFEDNWIAPLGPNVNGFEGDIESYLQEGVKVAALSTGTAAIHVALLLLGVKNGDEVLCQSMTFSASANPIAYVGATPIFIDSESKTWNLCPQQLEKAIKDRIAKGNKPKAIITVHLYGMPYQSDEIRFIADHYEIPIIEDAAEALGSTYKGIKAGTLGDMSILSFNGNKIITTSGGGALIVHKQEHKEKAIFYATQAREEAPHYLHKEIGYNYRMSNVIAGIGRGQIKVIDERVAQRRDNYEFYKANLSDLPGIQFIDEPTGHFSNRWLTTILVHPKENNNITREDIRLHLEKHDIETRPLWKPMHMQPVFSKYPYYGNQVAENLFDQGLCLPSGSNLTQEDLERVVRKIRELF